MSKLSAGKGTRHRPRERTLRRRNRLVVNITDSLRLARSCFGVAGRLFFKAAETKCEPGAILLRLLLLHSTWHLRRCSLRPWPSARAPSLWGLLAAAAARSQFLTCLRQPGLMGNVAAFELQRPQAKRAL